MAISALTSAPSQAASQPAGQSSPQHIHNGRRVQPISDIDAQGSSVASAPSPTGRIGSRVDITV